MTPSPSASRRHLLIVGPQGSGKGTQGARLAHSLGIPTISTGDLFRAHVAAGTAFGAQVNALMLAGQLVPDGVTAQLVRERLQEPDASNGFLLDGFPRTAAQARLLDAILEESGITLDAVLVLEVPRAESFHRLRRRALEQGRADDTDEIIGTRLDIYEAEVGPLLAHYGDLLLAVDGVGTVDEIAARIHVALTE